LVAISTDKAVRPKSIMGATKRVAEHVLQAIDASGSPTRLMAVRFGNVLGSRGSVVPLFLSQLRRGATLRVTHPDATRYFMTIREAALLVLQAGALGEGGEVFTLRMGEAVRIADLARDLVALSGLDPDDVPILYTGLRPGEKLHEELVAESDHALPAPHPQILVAKLGALPVGDVVAAARELVLLARAGNDAAVRAQLTRLLPDLDAPDA
jgi:FlaA1/EpsC-like NDP-sugar epimerase